MARCSHIYRRLSRFVTIHAFDRRSDGQTDGQRDRCRQEDRAYAFAVAREMLKYGTAPHTGPMPIPALKPLSSPSVLRFCQINYNTMLINRDTKERLILDAHPIDELSVRRGGHNG